MVQKEVSLTCVLAWVSWSLAGVSVVTGFAFPDRHLAGPVILFAAAAAVLHIRCMLHAMEDRMARREQQAFQMGRDSVRQVR